MLLSFCWVQKFEIDLDGAQTLRVLCYSQHMSVDSLLGKAAIEVRVVFMYFHLGCLWFMPFAKFMKNLSLVAGVNTI